MILNNRSFVYFHRSTTNIFLAFLYFFVIFYNESFCEERRGGNPLISGSILDINYSNPSFLPLSNTPSLGVRLPFPLTTTLSLSNSKFIVNDPTEFLYLKGNYSSLISGMLQNSFELNGLSPKEVSQKLTDELRDGVDIDIEFNADYLKIGKSFNNKSTYKGFMIGLKSNTSAELHVPGDAFSLLFSYEEGLQKGNVIDFSSLDGLFQFSTDLFLGYGKELHSNIKIGKRKFRLAAGTSIAYRMGHLMMYVDMQDGYIVYNNENVLNIHSNLRIKSAGIRFDNDMNIVIGSGISEYVNGHGFNLSGDICLYSDKLFLSLGLSDLGLVIWNNDLYTLDASFSKDSVTLLGLMEDGAGDSIVKHGEYSENYKHLSKSSFSLNVSFYSDKKNVHIPVDLKKISNARALTMHYLQPIIGGILPDYSPTFSFIVENEFFNGIMPFKVGWAIKTNGESSSFMQLRQVVTKGLSFTASYCAREDPFFRWNKGCEIAISSNIYFD